MFVASSAFHHLHLLLRQPIQFIHQRIDLFIGGIDLILQRVGLGLLLVEVRQPFRLLGQAQLDLQSLQLLQEILEFEAGPVLQLAREFGEAEFGLEGGELPIQ